MRPALADALGNRAALVFAEDASAVAAVQAAPREAGLVLLVIEDHLTALDRAMLIAAVGPLAIALAPKTRLCALDLGEGATLEDILATAGYLTIAHSTTGQVLRIAAHD